MILEIKIEVSPLVKAFLRYKHPITPFELYRNNQYGIFLYNALSHLKPVGGKKVNLAKYSETLRLLLPEDTYSRQGLHIHPQKVVDFNNMVLYNLDEDFCNWMDVCTSIKGGKTQDFYFAFRENYGLNENNFTLKCMEKKWERHRKRVNECISA
jgi:hypothetical protein